MQALNTMEIDAARPQAPPALARRHVLEEAGDPAARTALEALIARRYATAYGARISSFLPRLFAVHDEHDELLLAFGLRGGDSGRLFLETYLDAPIETLLVDDARAANRRHIVEIGNLAGRHPGALRVLIPTLSLFLQEQGYRWLCFTGTASLAKGFAKLGIELRVLAEARIERLPAAARADWGRYYETAPLVFCADIAAGRAHLLAHPELLRELAPPTMRRETP